jgi:hypothetical protein
VQDRSAAAGGDGPGDHPRARCVSDGRAAVQPGRDAPAAGDPDLTASADQTDDLLPGLAYNGVARLDPRAVVRPGERVTSRVDPNRLHFFDPSTGLAIGWPGDRAPDQAGARADSA